MGPKRLIYSSTYASIARSKLKDIPTRDDKTEEESPFLSLWVWGGEWAKPALSAESLSEGNATLGKRKERERKKEKGFRPVESPPIAQRARSSSSTIYYSIP